METWQTILLAIGGNTAVLAVLGFLGKSLLEKLVARDTKRFESDLKAKSDAAIEHLKGELQLKAVEHKERFSRLHEKRATVIAELYGCLVEMLSEAESFFSLVEWEGESNKAEKHRVAMSKLVEFFRFFDKNRIYLPEELCESLENLAMKVHSHIISFGVYARYREEGLNDHIRENKEKAWNAGWDAIKNEAPKARKLLEERFRDLLGASA
ncbi:hypothetical protein [Sphaerotilus sp.]|uniref:hypothetical protein n=1 Tax=Sphaerotilus sp. TaxID=2093942 RepID=UPI00286E4C8C|nr:hypothetical protein [Sphaerotilus sp.]